MTSTARELRNRIRTQGLGTTGVWAVQAVIRRLVRTARQGAVLTWYRLRSRGGVVKKHIQGQPMLLRANDPGISRELLLTGVHESRTTALVKREVLPGMTVVEVGANLGYYCLMEAALIGPTGRMIAFEPVPRNFELLNRNVALNGYTYVETHNLAVSDASGAARFALTDASNWGTMIDVEAGDKSEYIKTRMRNLTRGHLDVSAVSLDEFLAARGWPPVNFVRMDIEGYEVVALRGMMETLRRSPPPVKLLIEVHNSVFSDPEVSLRAAFEPLLDLGFSARVLIAKRDFFEDLSREVFLTRLCSYRDIVCHVLLVK